MLKPVQRWLQWKGLDDDVVITEVLEDRVFGWPVTDRLWKYCVSHLKAVDPPQVTEALHGGPVSFRENARPSLQVVFHSFDENVFVEMDFDIYPPTRFHWALAHLFTEVIPHALFRTRTNPDAVMRLLEGRIRKETGQ